MTICRNYQNAINRDYKKRGGLFSILAARSHFPRFSGIFSSADHEKSLFLRIVSIDRSRIFCYTINTNKAADRKTRLHNGKEVTI